MTTSTLEYLRQERRKEILKLADKHGMTNIKIFGSVARGEDRPDSDIDFLVTVEPGRSLTDRCAFWNDLEDLLERKVDVLNEKGLYWFTKPSILAEAKPL
jgi:uncharacterized protein